MAKPPHKEFVARIALLIMGVLLGFLICEIVLRAIGFSFELYPRTIEFGWPDPKTMETSYLPDKDVLWTPKDYHDMLATQRVKRPDIVFMGCSCTELGFYHQYFAELVAEEKAGRQLSYMNAGVCGWSSFQGLQQLERDILSVRPKIITIYYGWNDHWVGFGIEDKDVAKINKSFLFGMQRLRFAQLLTKAIVGSSRKEEEPNRVSIEDFRKNLRRMVRIAKKNGIIPVLLTAPTSAEKGKEPPALAKRWLRDISELIPLHESYASVVREIAEEEDVILCDLLKEFEQLPRDKVVEQYFFKDAVHCTDEGDKKLAEFLYETFEENGMLGELGE
ncbi:SGNH/GDSL hydrolase family protein [Candidatus Hydrogenedentota bacterium]